MKPLVIFLSLTLLIFSSCKKHVDPEPEKKVVQTDDAEMRKISASAWKPYRVDVNNLNVWDLLIQACQQDDTYRFYKDSTLMQYENGNVCNGNDDSTATHWEFYNGRKQVIATLLGMTDTADIVTLTDTDMQLSVDYNGNPTLIYFKKP